MFRLLFAISMLCIAGPANSQSDSLSGKWVVKSQGQAVIIIDVPPKGASQTVTIMAPEKGYVDKGHAAVGLDGAVKTTKFKQQARTPTSLEAVSTIDPTDVIILTSVEDGFLTLGYKQFSWFEPILFSRASQGETVGNTWSARSQWKLDEPWPDNVAIEQIFAADQAMREEGTSIKPDVAEASDRQRRQAVQMLLEEDKLRSANDFYRAAYIFQHGSEPRDFLKAHALAIVSAAKGKRDATWIAAATLDRYLQSIGQKQIYGTQYMSYANKPITQEPYDRDLLPDALRAASGIPLLAAQEQDRQEMEAAADKSKTDAGK